MAVILSQQEHQSLVVAALQIADILMTKIPSAYRQYLEREGVTFEISKLAYLSVELSLSKNLKSAETAESFKDKEDKSVETAPSETASSTEDTIAEDSSKDKSEAAASTQGPATEATAAAAAEDMSMMTSETGQRLVQLMSGIRSMRDQPTEGESISEQLEALGGELEAAAARISQPGQGSDSALSASATATLNQLRSLQRFIAGGSRSVATAQKDERGLGSGKIKDWILERARILVELFHTPGSENGEESNQGTAVLVDLKRMSEALSGSQNDASVSIKELAQYFGQMGVSGISSFEFLNSGLPQSLLGYLTDTSPKYTTTQESRIRLFVQEFMVVSQGTSDASTPTPLALLVKKMQEGLTRMETFEVETAQGSLAESRGGPSSSLATQVRLKLSPEEGTEVPSGYQNLIVSIHAIATFRTLDEYLRPRLKPKLAVPEKASISHTPKSRSKRPEDTTSKDTAGKSTELDSVAGATSEKSTTDGASDAQPNKNAEVIEPEDSFGESDEGDIEEMDCDLDQRSAVVDADVKMADATKSDTESGSAKRDDKGKPSKSRAASPSKKETAFSDSGSAWHIQFSLHGTPISTDMTVYGAIHDYERKNNKTATSRGIWSSMYPIKYKRVDTPAPEHTSPTAQTHGHDEVDLTFTADMPKGLPQSADYAPILGLLRILHGLNDDWRRFYGAEEQPPTVTQYMDQQEFVNSKISAKVNRQLEEPLIVASSCLPNWTVGLVTGFPFLFPFETRYIYLQSTAFGFSRSIMRWQNQQQRNGHTDQRDDSQNFLGRIQRQKVRISRQKALESAVRVMDLYGSHQAMLEVEYFEEVGTGLGPTLEFYSVVSKEFCKKFLKLWRDGDSEGATKYVTAPQGLYPRPMATVPGHADNHRYVFGAFFI